MGSASTSRYGRTAVETPGGGNMVRGVKFGSFVRSFPPADECVDQAVDFEQLGFAVSV